MDLTEKFRRSAYECFRWAREARNQQDNAMWLGMAQFWLQLAQHAEKKENRGSPSRARSGNPRHDSTDSGEEAPSA